MILYSHRAVNSLEVVCEPRHRGLERARRRSAEIEYIGMVALGGILTFASTEGVEEAKAVGSCAHSLREGVRIWHTYVHAGRFVGMSGWSSGMMVCRTTL